MNPKKRAVRAKRKAKQSRMAKASSAGIKTANLPKPLSMLEKGNAIPPEKGMGIADLGVIAPIKMKIGVANESGELLRTIETVGLNDFMDCIRHFEDGNYLDLYGDRLTADENGFEAMFVAPPEVDELG